MNSTGVTSSYPPAWQSQSYSTGNVPAMIECVLCPVLECLLLTHVSFGVVATWGSGMSVVYVSLPVFISIIRWLRKTIIRGAPTNVSVAAYVCCRRRHTCLGNPYRRTRMTGVARPAPTGWSLFRSPTDAFLMTTVD